MNLSEVRDILDAEVLTGEELLDAEVHSACGSDLMSDVLAYVHNQSLLLTGLVSPQVIRTAEMMDMEAIVLVRGKVPNDEMIRVAEARGIVLMTTELPMFSACGILYAEGLDGGRKAGESGE